MKTRSSFVANSSSSSFIIGCSKLPTTVEEAGDIWFGSAKDYVAPIILQSLFEDLKQVFIDFDLLLEKAKKHRYDKRFAEEKSIEDTIVSELFSNFSYREEYNGGWSYGNYRQNPFEEYLTKQILKKFPESGGNKYHSSVDYKKRNQIVAGWYKKKEVKEAFLREVESFIRDIKGYREEPNTVFMTGEFSDGDGELGSELEHGSHWDKFTAFVRFSHH